MNLRHRTKAQKETEIMSTPENVRLREEAAARCTAEIKRRVLRRQARKARAEHLVRCILDPRKKKAKRKPLTELYVKGHSPNGEETKEVQEKQLNISEKKGNLQFTENGRNAEITVDLVLQVRAKLSENKVNGPEDALVEISLPFCAA